MVGDEKSQVVAASDVTKDASNPTSNAAVEASNNNTKSETIKHAPFDAPNHISDVAVEGAPKTADKVVDLDALARRSSSSSSSSSPPNLQGQIEEKLKVSEEEKEEEKTQKRMERNRITNPHISPTTTYTHTLTYLVWSYRAPSSHISSSWSMPTPSHLTIFYSSAAPLLPAPPVRPFHSWASSSVSWSMISTTLLAVTASK